MLVLKNIKLILFIVIALLFLIFVVYTLNKSSQIKNLRTPIPSPIKTNINKQCGGFIKNPPKCPGGYHCKLGQIPDQGGICVKN